MEVTKSTREFKYNGVALKDPSAAFTIEQVREFYATLYPEIINAAIEGPTMAGAKTIYEFRRAVGTKGGCNLQIAQPLNYCRTIRKEFSEEVDATHLTRVTLDQLSDKGQAQLARRQHITDLCGCSEKFMLPAGGILLEDNKLRALRGPESMRLPFPFIALEFWNEVPFVIFVREREADICYTPVFRVTHSWLISEEFHVPAMLADAEGYVVPAFPPDSDPRSEVKRGSLSVIYSFLNAINCSNVHIEQLKARKPRKKAKLAIPFDQYHVLTVSVGGERAATPSGNHSGKARRRPREHLRRGHVVCPASGKPFWRNATVVAASGKGGVITKDYKLRDASQSHLSAVMKARGDKQAPRQGGLA